MTSKFYGLIGIGLLITFSGCSYYHEKDTALGNPQQYKANTVGYATVRDQIFTPKCIGCHSAGGHSPELDTYDSVKAALSDIRQKALVSKEMPPKKPLPDNLTALLGSWIEGGAPEATPEDPGTSASPTPSPVVIPLAPTYASIRANILVPKCITCHKAGSFAEKVPLDTYDDVMQEVSAGDPESSDLYHAITNSNPKKRMPPAVSGKTLSDQEIQAISDWIQQGATE